MAGRMELYPEFLFKDFRTVSGDSTSTAAAVPETGYDIESIQQINRPAAAITSQPDSDRLAERRATEGTTSIGGVAEPSRGGATGILVLAQAGAGGTVTINIQESDTASDAGFANIQGVGGTITVAQNTRQMVSVDARGLKRYIRVRRVATASTPTSITLAFTRDE